MTQWDASSINLFMDISTYCNAGCPQCHRTDNNGLGKVDWLPLVQWSLKQFKSHHRRHHHRHHHRQYQRRHRHYRLSVSIDFSTGMISWFIVVIPVSSLLLP